MGEDHPGPGTSTLQTTFVFASTSTPAPQVSVQSPGIRRVGAAKRFRYVLPNGKTVRDEKALRRIKSLAIPPAWAGVWIDSDENAHLQATGRDARGRKQYRYHRRWREVRDD